MSPAFAPDQEVITMTRKADIDAICARCKAGEPVKRYDQPSGLWGWSHSHSWLDACPAGPIWELTREEIAT
jgi:hypothetical protein